jgi:hypothetical protein
MNIATTVNGAESAAVEFEKAGAVLELELITLCDLMDTLDTLVWQDRCESQLQAVLRVARHQARVVRHLVSDAVSSVSRFDLPPRLHNE